jgi:hypothetical protein
VRARRDSGSATSAPSASIRSPPRRPIRSMGQP